MKQTSSLCHCLMPSENIENINHNISYRWAAHIIYALQSCGVEHFIISPGSRSTPLTMAVAAMPTTRKHVVLDERSAGFIALGIGKKLAKPAALICTSGTAAANYYPAVIEACKSAVPLIILSADRPPELHGTGANQTINQQQLFGNYAHFYDTGLAQEDSQSISALVSKISKLIIKSVSQREPLQINIPLSKPLEPTQEFYSNFEVEKKEDRNIYRYPAKQESPGGRSLTLPRDIQNRVSGARRPVLIAGQQQCFDNCENLISNLSEKLGAPLLAECTSQLNSEKSGRRLNGFNTFLRSEAVRKKLAPDLIISTGDAWVGKGLLQYLETHKNRFHIHITTSGLPLDTAQSVNHILDASELKSVNIEFPKKNNSKWLTTWQKLSTQYQKQTQHVLEDQDRFTDLHVFNALIPLIPEEFQVFTGNSLPIRDINRFAGMYNLRSRLFANRGASGIDGNISTAIGISLASEKPVITVTGDLTFLHDSNALLSARHITNPFIVVIINNGGGSIFDMLPVAEFGELMEPYFTTPQNANIKALAKAYELPFHSVQYSTDLKSVIKSAQSYRGISLVECKTNADSSMRIRNKLWQHHWHEYID